MIKSSVFEIISLRNVDRFSVPKPEKKMNFLTADDFLNPKFFGFVSCELVVPQAVQKKYVEKK